MIYKTKQFKHDDFEITPYLVPPDKTEYFIHVAEQQQYLHKDGTVRDHCGARNFHNTIKDAQKLIDKYFPNKIKLPDALFEIEI